VAATLPTMRCATWLTSRCSHPSRILLTSSARDQRHHQLAHLPEWLELQSNPGRDQLELGSERQQVGDQLEDAARDEADGVAEGAGGP
jgi:hypothetical protein